MLWREETTGKWTPASWYSSLISSANVPQTLRCPVALLKRKMVSLTKKGMKVHVNVSRAHRGLSGRSSKKVDRSVPTSEAESTTLKKRKRRTANILSWNPNAEKSLVLYMYTC